MSLSNSQIREYIGKFNFKPLFIELGWDALPGGHGFSVQIADGDFQFQTLTQKSGFQVFLYEAESSDAIPDRSTGLKLENKLTPLAAEHLVIFTDKQKTRQVWQWSKREAGSPPRISRDEYRAGGIGERLAQKLGKFSFSLAEEERGISITDVTRRNDAQFRERVTKRFYEEFKKQHEVFARRIEGINDAANRDWYASLTLNRLMFVYFIQHKGFLDSNDQYLRAKLDETKTVIGDDMFYSFYKTFLVRFFHNGLGEPNHSPELVKIIGKIPYLNGGLFEKHEIEINNDINIQDKAFEDIFDFFDKYDWHLDDRPLRDDNEINPDVLGYIFEKFINQKQMGAYYTKEDITDYISKNTIIPFLFDRVKQKVSIAFDRYDGVWKILRDNPDRYIYEAVKKGVIDENGEIREVPQEIAVGIDDVGKRANWNKTADEDFGLPTETWREYAARRQRCVEIRQKMQSGEIYDVNDLITYNLDITKFAEDVIFTTESSDLIKAFYHAIAGRVPERSNEKFEQGITVLDPTCGSGAFLFAALKILEPLLDKCLDRMEDFIEDENQLRPDSIKFAVFRRVLDENEKHPNRAYFVLKSIIVNNLFGVDIMPDAVEICKLRLFLSLVAQVDADANRKNYGLEPLPDIDFNIRAGNTLVGFANETEVYQAFQGVTQARLAFDDRADDFKWKAEETAKIYEHFRLQQIKEGGEIKPEDKANLQMKLRELSDELDKFIAHEYGIDEIKKPKQFADFLASHQPFHWYSEFFGIIAGGGFDVIIGNPPWKEYSAVKKNYTVRNYLTENCGNLHGISTERALQLRNSQGWLSMIVQLPLVSSSRMNNVRSLLRDKSQTVFTSSFDDRPGKLFEGLQNCRSVIFLSQGKNDKNHTEIATSRYQRWLTNTRENLFKIIEYAELEGEPLLSNQFPKYANQIEENLFHNLTKKVNQVVATFCSRNATEHFIFYQEATRYWIKATVELPHYSKNGQISAPAHGRYLYFNKPEIANSVCALLNSNLFHLYFIAYGDCFHLSDTLASNFPVSKTIVENPSLSNLNLKLMADLKANAKITTINTRDGDQITYEEFNASMSKPIIDEIDRVLAKHYGFTDEELDFIINYDIKYRMGREAEN